MRTAAILPVKRFAIAKRRLRAGVPGPVHDGLPEAMVTDVLDALGECPGIERTIVVTADTQAAALAAERGAEPIDDPAEDGQSVAVTLGVRHAVEQGFQRVLFLPGDCPALDPIDVADLLAVSDSQRASGHERSAVIVPDRHGTGTNALVLAPPDALAPSFGPDSFARHGRLARESGVACLVSKPPSLLLDIDTDDDLRALASLPAGHAATRAALQDARWQS
jgi:2-phospho-L-lactate guanylyltransferase